MNDIINQIIEIEHKAQEMLADAKKQKEEMLRAVDGECDQTAQNIDARRKKRMEQMLKTEQEAAEKSMASIREESRKKSESLDARFTAKKDEWVNEIYRNIVGR